MPVRTLGIAHAFLTAAGSVELFAVPAGKTLIVKEIVVSNSATGIGGVSLFVLDGAASVRVFDDRAIAINAHRREERFLVLEPDQTLNATWRAGSIGIWISGALLDGVAE